MTTKYRTRSGHPARILATDLKDKYYPLVVAVDYGSYEMVTPYTAKLTYLTDSSHSMDLVEDKPSELEVENEQLWKEVLELRAKLLDVTGRDR